jgi:hypothetical protein
MFGQVFNPTLEEIRQFGREEVVEPVLELSVIVEGNSVQITGESTEDVVIRCEQHLESRVDVEESPSPVPEWLLSSCLQCVVRCCHAEESLQVINPGVFAGLLTPDGEVIDNSVQQ